MATKEETDAKLLAEFAKAKGLTLEEAKRLLAKPGDAAAAATASVPVMSLPEEDDAVVVFGGPMGTFGDDTPTEDVQAPPIIESREPPPPPEMAPEPPMAEETEETSETSEAAATVAGHKCTHCGWDPAWVSVSEPPHEDKLAFLATVLGQQTYKKRLPLFGDAVRLTLRTLHVREIDAIYASAHEAQQTGIIASVEDYYEYINRMRVYLQICSLAGTKHSLHMKFPEVLSPKSVPKLAAGVETWADRFPEVTGDAPYKLLPLIESVMLDSLATEVLQRSVTLVCNRFNRTVAKMEAAIENPDFWIETKQPS